MSSSDALLIESSSRRAGDGDLDASFFRVLNALGRLVDANGSHLVTHGEVHHGHQQSDQATIRNGHHPGLDHVCLIGQFAGDPRWERLVRSDAPRIVSVDSDAAFDELRERMTAGGVRSLLFVPLRHRSTEVGYLVFVSSKTASLDPVRTEVFFGFCEVMCQIVLAVRANPSSGSSLAQSEAPVDGVPAAIDGLLASLTSREREIVDRLRSGQRVPTIARGLYLSPHTVRNHLKRIFRKLKVSSQIELTELLSIR